MQANEYEINDSFRSSYTPLGQTWCGKNIPRVKFDTFNPPIQYPRNCPGDWNAMINQSPQMGVQIVQETANFGYNALTHNAPASSSGYFNYMPAYNNDQCGYNPRFRKCDGTFVKLDRNPPASSVVIPNTMEGYRATPTTKTLTIKNVSGQDIGLSFRSANGSKKTIDDSHGCLYINDGLDQLEISINGSPKGSLLKFGCNSSSLDCVDSKNRLKQVTFPCENPNINTTCPTDYPKQRASYDCDPSNFANKLNFPQGSTIQITSNGNMENIVLMDGIGKTNNKNLLFIMAKFSADQVEFHNNGQSVSDDFRTSTTGMGHTLSVSVLPPTPLPTPTPGNSYYYRR